MQNKLNPSQLKAVNHEAGHLLIIAGPGTGKTHTITHRIAHLVQSLKDNEKILAITFTNKAALEMRHRLAQLSVDADKMFVGTFHSFCLSLLKEHKGDVKVALPEEILELTKILWPGKKLSQRKDMLESIYRWKAIDFDKEPPAEVIAYNNFLRERNLFDFDDLLLESLPLIPYPLSLYKHIFVDEYQDINRVQHALLKQWVKEGTSLCAIGDPNQAIYGFRGSDVKFFESFKEDFPGAKVLSLEENYRSSPNLLTACTQVIAKSRFRYVSPLTAKIFEEGRLTIYEAPTDKAEAEYVVHEIEKMVGGTSMFSHDSARVAKGKTAERGFGDIAVLYRLNSQKNALKEALERSGIPYEISGERSLEDEFLPAGNNSKYEERSEKIKLMTLHASKGLEFPVVFIVGCEENLLPLNLAGLRSDIEEERRLFYVGMTRAKEGLFLVSAKRRFIFGKPCFNASSIFLADIKEELKTYQERLSLPKKKKESSQLSLFDPI